MSCCPRRCLPQEGKPSPCCRHVCLGGEKAKGPRFLDAWHSHSNGETSRLQGHWRRVIGGEAVLKASYGYPHAESEMWILLGIHWLVSVGSCTIILAVKIISVDQDILND